MKPITTLAALGALALPAVLVPAPAQAAGVVSVTSPSCGTLRLANGTSQDVEVQLDSGDQASLSAGQTVQVTRQRGGDYTWMALGSASGRYVARGWTSVTACPGTASRPVDGDQDGDHRADILGVRAGSGELYSYRMTAAGLASGTRVGSGWNSMVHLQQVSEIDGAGTGSYLLAVRSDGTVYQYPSLGAGRFGAAKQVASGLAGYTNFAVLPLNNLALPGTHMLLASKGDVLYGFAVTQGSVDTANPVELAAGWSQVTRTIATRDVDGDHFADLVTISRDGRMDLRRFTTDADADEWLTAPVQVGHGWGRMGIIMSPGSVDGDRLSDLVARRDDGNLYTYLDRGGRWSAATRIGQNWLGIRLLA